MMRFISRNNCFVDGKRYVFTKIRGENGFVYILFKPNDYRIKTKKVKNKEGKPIFRHVVFFPLYLTSLEYIDGTEEDVFYLAKEDKNSCVILMYKDDIVKNVKINPESKEKVNVNEVVNCKSLKLVEVKFPKNTKKVSIEIDSKKKGSIKIELPKQKNINFNNVIISTDNQFFSMNKQQ